MIKKSLLLFPFLILAFVVTAFPYNPETPAANVDSSLSLSNLAVPEELGKVQERFTGSSLNQAGANPRTVIQIQDIHAHAMAQQNIAAILERLRVVFGIEKAALEGAWASTSFPKSHAIPTSREKQLLAGTLLDDDRISGPVYAAIMSPGPITLIGIEDETVYEKNRALFLAHLEKAGEIHEKLRAYAASLEEAKQSTWGPVLLAFGNAFGKFRDSSDLGKFFPSLWETAEAQGIDTSDFPQITLVRNIMALEKLFQREQLEQEVKHLMRDYKNTPWTLEELIRGGKIPTEKLGFYPELKKMTRLYQLRDQISLQELTAQINALTDRILGKIIRTPEEKSLWGKNERFYLARRILLLQASPADIKTFETEKTSLEVELSGAGLSEALSLSLDFYALVKQRDEIFFNRIMNDPSLSGNVAIITGGFHTDGLSQRFRDADISYITITPELGDAPMNEKLYNTRMAEKGIPNEGKEKTKDLSPSGIQRSISNLENATLSELRNAIAWVDDKFPEGYEVLLKTRDVREAEKVILAGTAAVPESTKTSHFSRQGKASTGSRTRTTVNAPSFQVSDFMRKTRAEQQIAVRGWLAQGPERREKAMLVSSISILHRILLEEKAVTLLEEAVNNGDIVALAQDVPATKTPKILSSMHGVDRFEAADITTLVEKTPRFQRLAKKHPFAIMENGRFDGPYVILPEKPVSLVLFRIITLNPGLYQAAKDPAFLAVLEDLVGEILSQELPKTSV